MNVSLTNIDIDSKSNMLGASGAFVLPNALQSTTPDESAVVTLNMPGGQQQQQEPTGPQRKSTPPVTQTDVTPHIAGWSNSGSLRGVEPNAPGNAATAAPDSTITTSAVAPSEAQSTPASEEKDDVPQYVHVLVVFDRSFCVCFVPTTLRSMVKVGAPVLCECGHGENIGTVVADMTSLIAEVMQQRQDSMPPAAISEVFTPPCEHIVGATGVTSTGGHPGGSVTAVTSMYLEKPRSGLPADHLLRRLPCVLRRGTNRDKKRLYFARLRSNDALAAVQRMVHNEPLTAESAEYHVSFATISIYLTGERQQCPWTPFQFEQLGDAFTEPLRSETVEFRFVSDERHEELDLTRGVTGSSLSEMLYGVVAEHCDRQVGRSAPSNRGTTSQNEAAGRAPPQLHPVRMAHLEGHIISGPPGIMTAYGGHPVWTQTAAALPAGAYITQAVAPQQQPQQALGYTIAPYVYVSPQQQHQQPHAQAIPLAAAQPAPQSLPFVQVQYPAPAPPTSAPPGGIYWANVSHAQQPPQWLDSRPQATVAPAQRLGDEPTYYYMVSPTQSQQAAAPPTQPTYVQAPAPATVQPPTFLQVPMLNTQGIPDVSYPFVLPANPGNFQR